MVDGRGLTEGFAKGSTRANEVVLETVMHRAEDGDEDVQEDPYEEEQPPPALVDHPTVPFLLPGLRGIRRGLRGRGRVHTLETLQPPALGLIPLEVAGLVSVQCNVGVLLQSRHFAV